MNQVLAAIAAVSLCALTASATGPEGGAFHIPWSTIDGGGVINASGGSFSLSGTIGQPDAGGPMTGGSFSLTGGFWAGVSSTPPCPADLAGNPDGTPDGLLNFFDVSAYLVLYGSGDLAADLAGNPDGTPDGLLNFFDVSAFLVLYGMGCP